VVRIEAIEWDEHNDWKPLAHGISLDEVEEVLYGDPFVRRSRSCRYVALGPTDEGRYVLTVFEAKPGGVIRPITARPMTDLNPDVAHREVGGTGAIVVAVGAYVKEDVAFSGLR